MTFIITVPIGLLLAYANGANDNFKGVATLLGSRITSYRRALLWATGTTALGSATALIAAQGLLAAFSGKGLVPAAVVLNPSFPLAVALAAGSTVLIATRLGLPISTTHALIGGLIGAGTVAAPGGVSWARLGDTFLLPLLVSPLLAIALSGGVYPLLRALRQRLGITVETCVCIGNEIVGVVPGVQTPERALQAIALPSITTGVEPVCRTRYRGPAAGVNAAQLLDSSHFLSAGVVSFARGLNDTPKIAALLLAGSALPTDFAIIGVALAIAAGGLVSARRVAETMAHEVTEMNPGQGLAANLITGLLVVGASNFGVPVSTTHVSCGSLFGIGAVTGQARWGTIRHILLAWVITLPVAAFLAAALMYGLQRAL